MPRTERRLYRNEIYPSAEHKVYTPNLILFFQFMADRQDCWHNRFVLKKPRADWTSNPILRVTKYTNVYRQLDRGSIWAIKAILEHFRTRWDSNDDTDARRYVFRQMLWEVMLYRMCSRIESMEKIGLPMFESYSPIDFSRQFYGVLEHHSPMTNAFLTCPTPKGMTKIDGFIINSIDLQLKMEKLLDEILSADTGDKIFKALGNIHGMGNFFCYEVYCDLCYSGMIPFTTNDFVNIGPGCMEGLRMIFPRVGTSKVKAKEKLYRLWKHQKKYFKMAGRKFKWCNWLEPVENRLSLRSVEHSLCEFSKYFLQINKVGKRRLEYDRWVGGNNFKIDDTGISVNVDPAIYSTEDCRPLVRYKKTKQNRRTWETWRDEKITNGHAKQDIIDFVQKHCKKADIAQG